MSIRFHEDLLPLLVPIENVSQHPENYNNGDTDYIVESILMNGMYNAVKVQRSTGYIVGGNSTYAACMELGSQTIPVIHLDIDDTEALRILITDNETARRARIEQSRFKALLDTIKDTPTGLTGTGVTEYDYQQLLQDMATLDAAPIGDGAAGYGEHIPTGITCPECGHSW